MIVLLTISAINCGSSSTSDTAGTPIIDKAAPDITLDDLLNAGISENLESQLPGTWRVVAYDLDEDPSFSLKYATTEEEEELTITFAEDGSIDTFSAPPLFDYETTYFEGYEPGDIYYHEGDYETRYFECPEEGGLTRCSETCNTSTSPAQCDNEYYCIEYYPKGQDYVEGYTNAQMLYSVVDDGFVRILKFTLMGDFYSSCCGPDPDYCESLDIDFSIPEVETKTSGFFIRGSMDGYMLVESDDSYIVFQKVYTDS